jgi:hypothetical protein
MPSAIRDTTDAIDQDEATNDSQEEGSADDASLDTPPDDVSEYEWVPLDELSVYEDQSDLGFVSTFVKRRRITRKEHAVYRRFHNTSLRAVSTNVKFSSRTPTAVVKVFNTTELLEMILVKLKPAHVFTKAQLTCRGLMACMETSPVFQRSMRFATLGYCLNCDFAWRVKPKCMRVHYQAYIGRLVFALDFTELSLERHRAIESFRRIAISNVIPQTVDVVWREGGSLHMVRLFTRQGEKVTFGRIFDAVAARIPARFRVARLSLHLMFGA